MNRTAPSAALSYVMDGRECIGFVLARGRLGFEALDREEQSLGLFPSQQAAANALTSKDKGPEISSPAPLTAGEPA
jgi:hypothetical protein